MLYEFMKAWKIAQSFRDLNELFHEGKISKNRCREWFVRFKFGDTSLDDRPGRGQPSKFDDQGLLTAVEGDESLANRMLADNFNVDHSAIVRRLKSLKKVWKLAGWFLHELGVNNKAERVQNFHLFASTKRAVSVSDDYNKISKDEIF
ncbi:histone-lysine N-methyltransferase SETMAR-like [Argiope bruennichi]|uniref:histone-lysine N-methyltransferase SETMAR-like n=1 Tax=Argiope bruennichi TaxID=94029 RepID=UPI0024942E8A|nr:histone-lysine N-methyltransferase SETMAR-like [Argiope bruennichi]